MSAKNRFNRWCNRFFERGIYGDWRLYATRKWTATNPLNNPPMRLTMWKARKVKEGGWGTLRMDMNIYRMMKKQYQGRNPEPSVATDA